MHLITVLLVYHVRRHHVRLSVQLGAINQLVNQNINARKEIGKVPWEAVNLAGLADLVEMVVEELEEDPIRNLEIAPDHQFRLV